MRIKLPKGKQKELIKIVKNDLTWSEFANSLKVNKFALKEWYLERCLLPVEVFKKLDKNNDFKDSIIEIKNNDWGKVKAGRESPGNKKSIKLPSFDENLAEIIGIILGDGNIFSYRKVRKDRMISTHQIRICGDSRHDYDYLTKIVLPLLKNIFKTNPRIYQSKTQNTLYIIIDGIEFVNFFDSMGLKAGNKIKNNLTFPEWVWKDTVFLKSCIRGLFDTDGSIYELKPQNPGLIQISFRNYNKVLLRDIEKSLKELGFVASKIYDNKICITKQEEVDRFFKEIKPNNPKHLIKYKKIRSPVV